MLILQLSGQAIGIIGLLVPGKLLLLLHLELLLLLHLLELLLLLKKLLRLTLTLALEACLLELLRSKVVVLSVHLLVGGVGRCGVIVGIAIGVHGGGGGGWCGQAAETGGEEEEMEELLEPTRNPFAGAETGRLRSGGADLFE